MKKHYLSVLVPALALGAFATGCGDGSVASAPTSTTPTTVHKTNPNFDYGSKVTITSKGFEPLWAVASLKTVIVFTNESTIPQRIVFDNDTDAHGNKIDSGVIRPGGSWKYHADNFVSAVYHSTGLVGVQGKLQVLPPEDP